MHRKKLIDTAMGRNDADIILKNGNVVDVFCGSVKKADVLIKDGYICGVGEYDGENAIDVVFTYGERSLETAKGAKDAGVKLVKSFGDKNELAEELKAFLKEGDAALFKASRGMKLEDVIYSVYESLDK